MIAPILNKQKNNNQTEQLLQLQPPLMREGTCCSQQKFNSLPNKWDETYYFWWQSRLFLSFPQEKVSRDAATFLLQWGVQTDLEQDTELQRALPAAIPVAGTWEGLPLLWHPLICPHGFWVTWSASLSLDDYTLLFLCSQISQLQMICCRFLFCTSTVS